jgi:ribose transport system permease protein
MRRLFAQPWLWAWLAAIATWSVTAIVTGGMGAGEVLTAAFTFATFSVIVALGQMFVITLGPGNVDLSIPATITLAGAVATKVMDTADPMILPGLLVALLIGVLVGCFNFLLILALRIPPIIATLSSSFLIQSTAIAFGRGLRIKPPPALADFTTAQFHGVPILAACTVLFTVLMGVLLHRTVYGRWVTAIGQNIRAAHLAGVDVARTRFLTYVLSAVLAGLCGYLLSGFSGGASLSMGEEYLLTSIAVVVIGGTSVAGGYANVTGLWGAALFLFLTVTMLNTYGFGAGIRYLATGLIIIAVIVAASARRASRA